MLVRYKETTAPDSPNVVLFSPPESPAPYYAEYGWASGGAAVKLPGRNTLWRVVGDAGVPLSPGAPVTLEWDNGEGLVFRRVISVDENYMFSVRQEVENNSGKEITLYPYALISRHGTPKTAGFWILHEGLIGVLGEEGYQTANYDDILEEKEIAFSSSSGWLGITDKYWAAVLAPDQKARYKARFTGAEAGGRQFYQTDYLLGAVRIPHGASQAITGNLFAGAKEVHQIDAYEERLGIVQFGLLIDWGWFYFITQPLFYALDFFYRLVGNFGVSILIVTVLVKLLFFPLANKSYVSMSKMKKLQPEMKRIQERFKDDRPRQQQALMELYQKEKVNPMSGCLPILIQIPVFFALYKVLFVTIEMRHAPFFGWIQDLSAKDPTSIFNLFGLLPYEVPDFLTIGVWPILMGLSMWVQMKLNPAPQDEIQKKIFAWMPVFFTFILAPFPAGLVIYWTWNNLLSIIQQWVIMSRQGVKVELFDNLRESFSWVRPLAERWGLAGRRGEAASARGAGAGVKANGPRAGGAKAQADADASADANADARAEATGKGATSTGRWEGNGAAMDGEGAAAPVANVVGAADGKGAAVGAEATDGGRAAEAPARARNGYDQDVKSHDNAGEKSAATPRRKKKAARSRSGKAGGATTARSRKARKGGRRRPRRS